VGLGLKFKGQKALNKIKASLNIGNYWYWLDQLDTPNEVPIEPLVYPLRYDILIRKSFFDFYSENRSLYREDSAKFIELAHDHPYFQWFTKVLVIRFHNESKNDSRMIDQLYAERVREAATLHDSISSQGFDVRFPIIPYTGNKIFPTDSGKSVSGTYFMGDGCHRLACLMSQGYTSIPRSMLRVKCFSQLRPIDNTAMLSQHLAIDWPSTFTSNQSRLKS
jgi:hypothetical protein